MAVIDRVRELVAPIVADPELSECSSMSPPGLDLAEEMEGL